MDVASLTSFLIPLLPFLMKFGKQATQKEDLFGETAWNEAQAIWSKLYPALEAQG